MNRRDFIGRTGLTATPILFSRNIIGSDHLLNNFRKCLFNFEAIIFFLLLVLLPSSSLQAQTSNNRPQTPKPPFPYIVDSVEYDNTGKTVHLGATFTCPKTGGPFVTLLMITGSGLQDRDETVFRHKPFAVIADYLTKKGYAVLRVDDRNIGKSKGDLKNATSADFADDVLASYNYLLQRNEVDKSKIGLIGHSEGGFIAPIVYAKNPGVAFIISLAGTGVPGSQILLHQQTDPAKAMFNQPTFDAYYDLTKMTLQTIHDNPMLPDSVILEKIKALFTKWKQSLPDSILKPLHADIATPEMYAVQIKTELIPWLKYFIATDPYQFWKQVKCPVLALNGEKDIQVDADENISAIKKALNDGGNKNVTIMIFPGLNHLFQHCTKCTIPEYGELEETISPDVLDEIGKWLDAKISK
jgi:pimeloyl-ACP methyl ester carboxylesterase